jgi:general secretion pathway protein N
VRAQIGDEIDGWKVSQIEGRKVVLSLDGRFATFKLFNDDRGESDANGGAASDESKTQVQQAPSPAGAPQAVQPSKLRRSRE